MRLYSFSVLGKKINKWPLWCLFYSFLYFSFLSGLKTNWKCPARSKQAWNNSLPHKVVTSKRKLPGLKTDSISAVKTRVTRESRPHPHRHSSWKIPLRTLLVLSVNGHRLTHPSMERLVNGHRLTQPSTSKALSKNTGTHCMSLPQAPLCTNSVKGLLHHNLSIAHATLNYSLLFTYGFLFPGT